MKTNCNETWVIDVTSYVHEVKGHISRSKVIGGHKIIELLFKNFALHISNPALHTAYVIEEIQQLKSAFCDISTIDILGLWVGGGGGRWLAIDGSPTESVNTVYINIFV